MNQAISKLENTKKYRVMVVALLMTGVVINSFDRAALSVAAPFIIKEFGIDAATMGVALSAFFWTYVIGNALGGNLVDRFGSKAVLGWSATIWSIFSALTGFAQNATHIVFARLGVGAGEAPAFPANAKVVANNFPSSERGTAIGVYSAGNRVGLALCPIIMALLITSWGWRVAFFVTGLGSMIWVAFWYFGFRDLARDKARSAGPVEKTKIPWKEVFSNRAILGIIVVKFTQDFLQWQFMTWVPGYLIMGRGLSPIKMGFYTSLAFAVAAFAQPIIGWFSDWLIKRGWSVNRARKSVQVALQLLSATIIITGFSDDIGIALFFLVVAISAESTAAGHIWTIMTEVIPCNMVGSITGVINAIGAIAGIVSPILTGVIVKVTGSFQLALTIGGCSILVAAVFIIFIVPKLVPLELGCKPEEAQPVYTAGKPNS
jgi:MFS family permease